MRYAKPKTRKRDWRDCLSVHVSPLFSANSERRVRLSELRMIGWTFARHGDPRYLIIDSGNGPRVVGDGICNCPAGAHGKACKHKSVVTALGGVEAIRRLV